MRSSLDISSKTIAVGGVLLLLFLTGRGIGARQQPQPQPVPTPPPAFDLNGKWVTNNGEAVVVRQDGSTVSAKFDTPQPCPSGGQRANLLVGARYSGNRLSGTADYIACAFATPPFLSVCRLPSVHATKFDATVSEDGATITGEWFARGHWITLSGGQPVACRPDSDYDVWTAFTLTRCGALTLNLTSTDNFHINKDPKMSEVKGDVPDSTAQWESEITFSRGRCADSGPPNFNSFKVTGSGATFTPQFGAIYGGRLSMTVRTACGVDTKTQEIVGDDPGKDAIQTEIGSLPALPAPFDADDLKRIACQESSQRQFLADGKPKFGGGGDVGIMQICWERTTADVWDWKHNIARGRRNLMDALARARSIPNRVRTSVVREGCGETGGEPCPNATDFTDEQLRMEALQRYNAYHYDNGYWQWDDEDGWVAQPQMPNPDRAARKTTPVVENPYADEVDGRSPTCPGS